MFSELRFTQAIYLVHYHMIYKDRPYTEGRYHGQSKERQSNYLCIINQPLPYTTNKTLHYKSTKKKKETKVQIVLKAYRSFAILPALSIWSIFSILMQYILVKQANRLLFIVFYFWCQLNRISFHLLQIKGYNNQSAFENDIVLGFDQNRTHVCHSRTNSLHH